MVEGQSAYPPELTGATAIASFQSQPSSSVFIFEDIDMSPSAGTLCNAVASVLPGAAAMAGSIRRVPAFDQPSALQA